MLKPDRALLAIVALCATLSTVACKEEAPPTPPPQPPVTTPEAAKPDVKPADADAKTDEGGEQDKAAKKKKLLPPPEPRFGKNIDQTPSQTVSSKDLEDGKTSPAWKTRALKTTRIYKARGQATVSASFSKAQRAVILDHPSSCYKQVKDGIPTPQLVNLASGKVVAKLEQLFHAALGVGAIYAQRSVDEQREIDYLDLETGANVEWLSALKDRKVEVIGEGDAAWIVVMRKDGKIAAAKLSENPRPLPPKPSPKKSKEPPPESPPPLAEPSLVSTLVPDVVVPTAEALFVARASDSAKDCLIERLSPGQEPTCTLIGAELPGYKLSHWLNGWGIFEDHNNNWRIAIEIATSERVNPVPSECKGASITTVSRREQPSRVLFKCADDLSEATYALWSPEQSWVVRDSSALSFKEPLFRDGLITVGVGAGRKNTPRAAYIFDGARGNLYRSFLNEDLEPARSNYQPFIYDLNDSVFDAEYAFLNFEAADVQMLTKWRCEHKLVELFHSDRILAFGCVNHQPVDGVADIKDLLVLDLKTWSRVSTNKLVPVALEGDLLYLVDAKNVDGSNKTCDGATIHVAKL